MTLSAEVLKPVLRSIEQFQLGDGGGPACLIAFDAERFRGSSPEVRTLDGLSGARLDAFFAYDPAFTGGLFVAARG